MPLYVVISDDVRERILRGELPPASRLPSEREVCEEWNCSTITARGAMAVLRDEGLIHTVRGSGTFVAPQPERIHLTVGPLRRDRPHGPRSRQPAPDQGMSQLQIEHLSRETVEASAEVAERLDITLGEFVTEVVHRATLQGETVAASCAWESPSIGESTASGDRPDDPFMVSATVRRFASAGLRVGIATHNVRTRMPEPAEIHRFKIPAGVPVVQMWRTLLAEERTVQVAKIIYRADRYEFTFIPPPRTETPAPHP